LPSSTVKLTGWKAVAVLLVLAAWVGFHYYERQVTLDTAGRDAVRDWVVLASQRGSLASRGAAGQLDSAAAVELMRRSEVEIRSMRARGLGDNVVVRVELAVHGGPPPDGRAVRYFRLLHSTLTGWRVVGESKAIAYYAQW
jgi:hypothetical protein